MSQPIALGTILGGRYKVSASLRSTAEGDHVLQGEDQILRRRVSILVPAVAHESTVVDNARSLAGGAGHSGFQVLDMGQTEDTTYLVTSYAPATDLLDTLLRPDEDSDDYSLSDDIFGDSRPTSSSSYIYQEPDPTQPQQRVSHEDPARDVPAVTRWDDSDEDYDDAPAAPSVRNRLGMARRIAPGSVRSTLFDRAASRNGSAGATVAAGAIDPTYDGDNRYESYERTEGKPGHLDDPRSAGSTGADPSSPHDRRPGDQLDDDAASPRPGTGTPARGNTAAAADSPARKSTPVPADPSPAGATAVGATRDEHRSPVRWLLLALLTLLLVAAIVLGFRGLGSLSSQFSRQAPPQQNAAPAAPEGSAATSSRPTPSASPEVAAVSRVTPNPAFMADTDATLNQATDGNPATYWLSYGFSNATFGNLTDSVGLAVQLKEPAAAQELTVQQADGSGGQFTVYVADQPSLDGAEQVGSGSFTGPEVTVPLSDAARTTPHGYVLVVWTELPRLTNPIGGYPYGLRISEISVR
ncbi:hypothetical protein [Kocuria sp.]|uniref:hypothetical protein n=1 Tax=Kocuria sp. TaxID=1871328 RepID=UPI0026DB2F26|nr:hypothetical protein [Kocuria sp.]MDO4919107.1 hypothetical protein [Kocuria sp.]